MTDQAGGPGWYECTVLMAGPAEDGVMYVMLTHVIPNHVFTGRWFKSVDNVKEQMLATALTALTTGYHVSAALADSAEYSTLNRLYAVVPA